LPLAQTMEVNLKVYPNPSQGLLHVEDDSGKVNRLKVYDLMGRVQLDITLGNGNLIDLTKLDAGNYFVHCLDQNAQVLSMKHIIKL